MAKKRPRPDRAPGVEPRRTYSDGHPLDEVHYLECKIILKPDRFTSPRSFLDFGKLVRSVADESDVGFSTAHLAGQKPQIREVVARSRRSSRCSRTCRC